MSAGLEWSAGPAAARIMPDRPRVRACRCAARLHLLRRRGRASTLATFFQSILSQNSHTRTHVRRRVMCQLREAHNTDLQRYSILNELLSSNQCLFYKVGRCGAGLRCAARRGCAVLLDPQVSCRPPASASSAEHPHLAPPGADGPPGGAGAHRIHAHGALHRRAGRPAGPRTVACARLHACAARRGAPGARSAAWRRRGAPASAAPCRPACPAPRPPCPRATCSAPALPSSHLPRARPALEPPAPRPPPLPARWARPA